MLNCNKKLLGSYKVGKEAFMRKILLTTLVSRKFSGSELDSTYCITRDIETEIYSKVLVETRLLQIV